MLSANSNEILERWLASRAVLAWTSPTKFTSKYGAWQLPIVGSACVAWPVIYMMRKLKELKKYIFCKSKCNLNVHAWMPRQKQGVTKPRVIQPVSVLLFGCICTVHAPLRAEAIIRLLIHPTPPILSRCFASNATPHTHCIFLGSLAATQEISGQLVTWPVHTVGGSYVHWARLYAGAKLWFFLLLVPWYCYII